MLLLILMLWHRQVIFKSKWYIHTSETYWKIWSVRLTIIPNIWYTSKDKKHKAVRSHLNIPILKQMDIITLHLRSHTEVWYTPPSAWLQRNPMMTSSNGNIFRVTGPLCGEFTGPGEFPTQRPLTRSFDVFFDRRLNKRLSKLPRGWWSETLSCSLWRQSNAGWSHRWSRQSKVINEICYPSFIQWLLKNNFYAQRRCVRFNPLHDTNKHVKYCL